MKPLVILAHPDLLQSRSNKALLEALSKRSEITIHQLYASYPDWQIDVKREQELVEAHDRIVFQFPMYWYSTPPLLKKWQDDVLEYGWAYGTGGNALKHKELFVTCSIGGHPNVYRAGGKNQFTISEILKPLQATANICGMTFLPTYVVGGHLDDDGLAEAAQEYAELVVLERHRGTSFD